jgi:hypothetical protein
MSDQALTEVREVPPSTGEVIDVAPRPLTLDEDNFALSVIEYGGNLGKAYQAVFGEVSNPTARARALLARPEIVLRIKDITESVADNALISLGSHLVELADIRDLAKNQGQLKVALNAEEARGKVAGFYVGKSDSAPSPRKAGELGNPMILISVTTAQDHAI